MKVFRNTSTLIMLHFCKIENIIISSTFISLSCNRIMGTYFPIATFFLDSNINGPNQSGLDLISRFISRM